MASALTAAYSDNQGGFVLRARAPASYTIAARRIGYPPSIRAVALRGGSVDTVRMELQYENCVGY
jgi:hypothetical protein